MHAAHNRSWEEDDVVIVARVELGLVGAAAGVDGEPGFRAPVVVAGAAQEVHSRIDPDRELC